MIKNGMRPIHPGEILSEDFMKPSVPPINASMLAKSIAAARLAAFFNTTAEFWMNMQQAYELRLAERALPERVKKHIEESREALVRA